MAYTTFGWGHDWTRFHKSERSRLFPSAPTKSATSCNFPGQFRPELYSTPNFETVSYTFLWADVDFPETDRLRALDSEVASMTSPLTKFCPCASPTAICSQISHSLWRSTRSESVDD